MSNEFSKIDADRRILSDAHQKGKVATVGAFFRLSGPGWLQSAITLGGGSLGSALFLGMLSGYSLLWVQLVAIIVGVIMLSAISYVTLSTGKRPYQAINEHINPVLGVGWLAATVMANMIWIMPQFSLCFDVLETNLGGEQIHDTTQTKIIASVVMFLLAAGMILLSVRGGLLSRLFDLFLKLMVAMIVVCFVGVVVYLFAKGHINAEVFYGFIPDLTQWSRPSGKIGELIQSLPVDKQQVWNDRLANTQQMTIIASAATAVGINMTFLLPYSMLNRGWDKPFRGLARFDLITGMAIPYILVTSCIVIASAYSFHATADKNLLSDDPAVISTSPVYSIGGGVRAQIDAELPVDKGQKKLSDVALMPETTAEEKTVKAAAIEAREAAILTHVASLSPAERTLYVSQVKPNTAMLAQALVPLLGKQRANLLFGIGVFGMGFSTIVVLMMINGFAFREMFNMPDNQWVGVFGALLAGVVGVCWIWIWTGPSKPWITVMASIFGAMLLPIAYVTFMAMMNSRSLLGAEKPTGLRMIVWNILMAFGVIAATANAVMAIQKEFSGTYGMAVIGVAGTFLVLALIGFSARPQVVTVAPQPEQNRRS
jgi:Mn2+/Fe2+ NRAMP family transporter